MSGPRLEANTGLLVTLSGNDRPGITSEFAEILSEHGASLLDLGQAVVHGQLSLSFLIDLSLDTFSEETLLKDLLLKASILQMKLEYRKLPVSTVQGHRSIGHRYAVTLMGEPLLSSAIHLVTKELAKQAFNIDFIHRLSQTSFSCLEFLASSSQTSVNASLKRIFFDLAKKLRVDIAVQEDGIFRRSKKLIVFDMDSTLIENEVIDEMAKVHGCFEEVSKVTAAAMQGGLDFSLSLKKRMSLLKGMRLETLANILPSLALTPGAKDLVRILQTLGFKTALISGGFRFFAEHFANMLQIDSVHANQFEIDQNTLTGEIKGPILDAHKKAELLTSLAREQHILLDQVVAVGDGANDIPMLEAAGLGIAFHAKPSVEKKAHVALRQRDLKSVLYLLGISEADIIKMQRES